MNTDIILVVVGGLYMNIIEQIEEEVIRRCNNIDNKYGEGAWSHHIKSVVENAIILSRQYNADEEIVTLAALLHDVASVTKEEYYEKHHVIGAEIAEDLLNKLEYPKDKIERIKNCILNHRGSKLASKLSIEEICVADADAMAHFDNIPSLFSLVYKEKGMLIDDGAEYIKNKLQRSYNKLSDSSKDFYKSKYEKAMSIFK